jgi:hypothetical protein
MRIVSAVSEPGAVVRILRHLGESAQPPPTAGPRAPPHEDAEAERRKLDLVDLDPAKTLRLDLLGREGRLLPAWRLCRESRSLFSPGRARKSRVTG